MKWGAVFGYYVAVTDSLLDGGGFWDSLDAGKDLTLFGAAVGGVLAPTWLMAVWGHGIAQALAIAGVVMGESALVGVGVTAVADSIRRGNYPQAGFRAAVTMFVAARAVRGLQGVCPRVRPVYEFSNLNNASINEILDAIPPDAQVRILPPEPNGVQDGVEFTFAHQRQTWRVRIHGPDANPNIPAGNNARIGWIVRVQRGRWFMDSNGTFHPHGTVNAPSGTFCVRRSLTAGCQKP